MPQIDLDVLLEVVYSELERLRDKRKGEHLIQIMPQEMLYWIASRLDEQDMQRLRAQGMTNNYCAQWLQGKKEVS